MKNLLTVMTFILLTCFTSVYGQSGGNGVEMADALRQNGKIYVVVTVVCIIFAGLFIYLVVLDNKLKKLEKEIKNKS